MKDIADMSKTAGLKDIAAMRDTRHVRRMIAAFSSDWKPDETVADHQRGLPGELHHYLQWVRPMGLGGSVLWAYEKLHEKYLRRKPSNAARRQRLIDRIRLSDAERKRQEEHVFSHPVKISIIVPLYNTPSGYLHQLIDSVESQTYRNWELCLADASDTEHPDVGDVVAGYAAQDARILYTKLPGNEGISDNTNQCLALSTGVYVALLDHDDMLHPSALYEVMEHIEADHADFIYTDELTFFGDTPEDTENIQLLHFKPDFSPQNLNGANYICHLCVFKRSLLQANGLYDSKYDGSQDHDMMLRLAHTASKIVHIPKILYFWRVHQGSVSMDISAKPYAIEAGRRAVHDSEMRQGRVCHVHSTAVDATHYKLVYKMKRQPSVTVIVLCQHPDLLNVCVASIAAGTRYSNYRIVVADFSGRGAEEISPGRIGCHGPQVALFEKDEQETTAHFLNRIVQDCDMGYVCFVPDTMLVTTNCWLKRLVEYAAQDGVGPVGMRLVDSFGRLKENGYILGLGAQGICLPIDKDHFLHDYGYMGRNYYVNNISAISLYGMMIAADKLRACGMLSEELSTPRYLGIDLCIRALSAGLQVVMQPYAVNMLQPRGKYRFTECSYRRSARMAVLRDEAYMRSGHGAFLAAGDPYYNPNLADDGTWDI